MPGGPSYHLCLGEEGNAVGRTEQFQGPVRLCRPAQRPVHHQHADCSLILTRTVTSGLIFSPYIVFTSYLDPCSSLKWFDSGSSDMCTQGVFRFFPFLTHQFPGRKKSSRLLSICNIHRCSVIHAPQPSPEVAEVTSSHFTGEEPEAKFQMLPGVQRRAKRDLNRC